MTRIWPSLLSLTLLLLYCEALSRPRVMADAFVGRQYHGIPSDDQEDFQVLFRAALSVRGGAMTKKDGGIPFLGALIKSLEKQSPILASCVRTLFSTIESVTGMKLLPKKKTSKKKKRKNKQVEEDEDPEDEAPTKTPSKKKSSSNKSKKKKAASKSSLAKAHVQKELKATSPNYRIQRELKAFLSDPPPNLTVKVGKNLRVWIVTMKGAENTIYEGETFQLRISFPPSYPTMPPSVYFLPPNIPVHEHVYTNGDICLSLLGKDWRPTMTAQSIAVSILSILSSAQSKSLPMDNARHAQNKPGEFQKDWVYHE